jgi:hypothetical protein
VKPVSRRSFIALVAAGITGGGIAIWRSWTEGESATAQTIEAFLSDPEAARRLGEDYLRSDPATTPALARAVAPAGVQPDDWFADVGRGAFARRVRGLAADDWKHGRVVVVQGWRLAATEARLCALYARVT